MKDEHYPIAAMCFTLMLFMLTILVPYRIGLAAGQKAAGPIQDPVAVCHKGELPVGVPVMVYWVNTDGCVRAESAIRTDFAGVLPYSVTADAVPYLELSGWDYWTRLEEVNP